jgi:hypothetical protein
MSRHEDKETRTDKLKRAALNHPLVAILVIAATAIIAFNQFAAAMSSLAERTGIRPDALDLANENSKGAFSRQLTELAYRRIFWASNFTARLRRQAPQEDVGLAWQRYMDTVEEWSANLVNSQQQLRNYYGDDKEREFTACIHKGFRLIHRRVVDMRYSRAGPDRASLQATSAAIDAVNEDVYFFVLRLSAPERRRAGTRGKHELFCISTALDSNSREDPVEQTRSDELR